MRHWKIGLGWMVVLLLAVGLYAVGAHHDPAVIGLGAGPLSLAMAGTFGARYQALSKAAVEARATPNSGNSAEAIWHQLYHSLTYTSGATTRLVFFQDTAGGDKTLSNMETGGALPRPQSLQIHNICVDVLSIIPVTTSATLTGVLNDLALLLFGSAQRPTWTLHISSKAYGPYSLTTLHGTGGPTGFGFSGDGAEIIQFAKNDPDGGWNYFGNVIIPEQVNFDIELNWAAFATMSENKILRVSLFGVLNRRVL
jgi:hypothetical protein